MRFLVLVPLLWASIATADTLAITEGKEGLKYPGKFIWADLVSDSPVKAAEFYTDLFGWQVSQYDDDYWVLRNKGRLVAGITRNRAEDEDGSRWISFVSVSDIDETHTRLINEGAISVAGPVSVEGRGDLAIYVAPDGAVFGTLISEVGDPEEMGADIGDFVWIELWSKEPKVAADFYGRLGYQVEKNWASQNENDLLLVAGDYARGGIVEGHPQQKDSGWLLYVRVDDVASAMARAEQLGGRAINLQGESNALGDIGLLADPTGGVVAVYQYLEPEGGEAGE